MTIYSLDTVLSQFWNDLFLTVASWPAYRFLRRQVRWSDIPIFKRSESVLIHTVKGFLTVLQLGMSSAQNSSLEGKSLPNLCSIWSKSSWRSGPPPPGSGYHHHNGYLWTWSCGCQTRSVCSWSHSFRSTGAAGHTVSQALAAWDTRKGAGLWSPHPPRSGLHGDRRFP